MPTLPYWERTTGHILSFQPGELSNAHFERLVLTNTPCVLRGAALEWPAIRKWTAEYLSKHCDLDGKGLFYERPRPREAGYLWEKEPAHKDPALFPRDITAREFFAKTQHSVMRLSFPPLDPAILADVNHFAFPFRPPREAPKSDYSIQIAYLYRGGSFTDWHMHFAFEAMMCQIRGAKDVLLLPPTAEVWRALAPALDGYNNSFDIPRGAWPAYEELRPILVRVEPGDVVYIPAWWWHAVEAVDNDFGITLPNWWSSPLRSRFDPSIPQLDHYLWRHLPHQVMSWQHWANNPKANLWRALFLAGYFASSLPFLTSLLSGSRFGSPPRKKN